MSSGYGKTTHESEGRALGLLLTTELEAIDNIRIYSRACERRYALLAALEGHLHLVLADGALQTEYDLLGRLRLLVEDGLGLTTVTRLFAVVTALALGGQGVLALLVLRHLVRPIHLLTSPYNIYNIHDVRVLPALLACAVYRPPSASPSKLHI